MSYYDPSEKVTSEGPDGFMLIDFSKFKGIWDDETPAQATDTFIAWEELANALPEEVIVEDAPAVDPRFEKDVLATIRQMDVVEEAKDRRDARDRDPFEEPPIFELVDFLSQPDNPVYYKVDQLWPVGGNVLFAAPAKFGKSTVMMNLVRSLLDGTPFLTVFGCPKVAQGETILLIDLEMSQDRVRSELRAQEIKYPQQLVVAPLRGKAKDFDLRDDETRSYWVKFCKDRNVQTLLLDPLAPLMGYMGVDENDNTMVNQMFQMLDAFKDEAGIRDMMVVHHCGHSADWRPRGASRFNDWPDALWLAKINGPVNDPQSPREFFARGRDVGENFHGEGTISRDLTNPKKLIFDFESAATQEITNSVWTTIENLFYTGNPVNWVAHTGNKKSELIDLVVAQMLGLGHDVTPNKVETIIDALALQASQLHMHEYSLPGTAGKKPWRAYPAHGCPLC